MPTPFAVSLRAEGCNTVVFVSGEIDLTAEGAVAEVGRLAVGASGNAVVVDLADLTFIDSSGLSALVRIRSATVGASKSFALRNVPARSHQLLKLCGLEFLESS